MLDDVGERLGNDEVGARLDLGREPCVGDVDLDRGFFFVAARTALKTPGSEAPVPLPAEAAGVLAEWLPRRGCTPW